MSFLTGNLSSNSYNQNTSSQSNTSGTSTTTRNLTPYQAALQSPLSNLIGNIMSNPAQYLAPYQTSAVNSINSNYSGLADTLRQQFLQSGGGSNGKFGTALAQGDLQRLGQISQANTAFQQSAAALPLQASNLALNFLGQNFGQTTAGSSNTSGTTATSGSSSGWNFGGGLSTGL